MCLEYPPETQREARELILQFAGNTRSVLQFQREIVIEGKAFKQTAAIQQRRREKDLEAQRNENEGQRREQEAQHQAKLRAREMKALAEAQAAREEQERNSCPGEGTQGSRNTETCRGGKEERSRGGSQNRAPKTGM